MISCRDITTLKLSPLQLDTLLATTYESLSASTFIIGGEELTSVILNRLKCNKKGDKFQVWNEYGPTETTVGCIAKCFFSDDLPLDQNEMIPIGQPIDNVTVSVAQQNHLPIRRGGKGTLSIGGKCLCSDMIGNRRMFTAAPWGRPGEMMFVTDDVVQVLPTVPELLYYGRDGDSNTAKINDIRVDLMEVQNAIQANLLISSAWVSTFEYRSHTYLGAAMIPNVISGELLSDREFKETISVNLIQILPKESVPKVFIILSKPPITVNGKKDLCLLKNLFVSDMALSSQTVSVGQISQTAKLQHIWHSVLPINHIPQPEENFFFELCGDSLQAICLVQKLRDEGYIVDITDIFTYPSIKQLSPVLSQRDHENQRKSEPVPSFRPTPIIEEFLVGFKADQCAFSALLHFNVRPGYDVLKKALKSITNKHMSLHSKFVVQNGIALQIVVDITDEHAWLTEIDIHKNNDELPDFFTLCESLEQSHSLCEGILMNAAIINYCTESSESDTMYVLVVVHHIAIDIVSWHQILIDLAMSLKLLSNEETCVPELPECVIPFSAFCRALRNEPFESEIPYWKDIETLSRDSGPSSEIQNQGTYESAEWCSVTLDASNVHLVTSALQCSEEVLVLTVFGRSLNRREKTVITLESHGRQLPSVDSTDTVGWCTSKFPFVLDTPITGDPVDQIKLTHENKSKIPNQGLGFSVLKSAGKLSMGYPKTSFVFQGHLDTATNQYFDGGKFQFEQIPWLDVLYDEFTKNSFHRQQSDTLQFDLEVTSWIYKGELRLGCLFNNRVVSKEAVNEILDLTILDIKLLSSKLAKMVKIDIEFLSSITITQECTNIIKESLRQREISVNECLLHPPEQIIQQLSQGHSKCRKNRSIAVVISRFRNQLLAEDFVQACCTSMYLENAEDVIIINADSVQNSIHHSMNEIQKLATVCSLPEYISNFYYKSDSDVQYGMPFTQIGYGYFGLHIARVIHDKVSKTKYKVIAVAADYTLWDGECAEGNVILNEANIILHKFLLQMKLQGKLLVVLSKNYSEDVERAFKHTMESTLTSNDFVTIKAEWRPKPDNIKDIARTLNLCLDSFVFIDHNPLECEQMQKCCPEVLTLQFPAASNLVSALFDNLWALDSHASHNQVEPTGLKQLYTWIESTWSPIQKMTAAHHLFPIFPLCGFLKEDIIIKTDLIWIHL